jgi:hypothetical protein
MEPIFNLWEYLYVIDQVGVKEKEKEEERNQIVKYSIGRMDTGKSERKEGS